MLKINDLIRKLFAPRTSAVKRWKTRDNAGPVTALPYRMGAGYPGDVNRSHPASIEPCLIDAAAPPTAYGQPVVVDAVTQGVRPLNALDVALTAIYGITVRPYPLQQAQGVTDLANGLGVGTPPASGVIDVLRSGYIMGRVNGAAVKGGRVFIWIAATAAPHIQGTFEIADTPGSCIELDEKSYFNGSPDANGNVEVSFNI